MLARTLPAALAAVAWLTFSPSAQAAPCGTFTDVQDTDSFCKATQWLRNREVTLGCTSATLYCPADVVTRASMALFMNRLGTALTPRLVGRQSDMAPANLTPGQFVAFCFGSALPAVNHPQTARARGSINVAAAGPGLSLFLVMTLNGQPYVNMNTVSNGVASPNGIVTLSWSSNTVDVPAGSTAGFAVGVSNSAGAGTLVLGQGVCALEADVINANPVAPPFDP